MSTETTVVPVVQETKSPSLTSDFSWTLVGNAVYAGGQFATLMLLAKLLRPELVGQYALGLAVVYPVMMFTNLQLRAVMSSGSHQNIHFGNYLSLRLLTTLLALALVFAVTQILGYDRELTTVVLMVGLAYGVETLSDVYYARLQLHDRMAEISKSMMARALLSVLGLAVVTFLTRSLLWGVAAIFLARLIVFFGFDVRARTHGLSGQPGRLSQNASLALRFDSKALAELAWVSLPLGIVVLLGCLNSSVPTFFIKHALGERDVGIFAAIGFIVSVGNMAVVSLGQSAFTRLARACAARNVRAFSLLLGKLLCFGAAIGASGMFVSKLAGREILTLVFRPEYAERADLLTWMMAAGGVLFMAQFLGFGLTAANFYHSQVVLNIVANVSLLAACYWLVERQGLLGAILAMLIAAIVQLAGSIIVLVIGMRRRSPALGENVGVPNLITPVSVSRERNAALNSGD
jgi:O-antigen/teichoic acid export membrane protein